MFLFTAFPFIQPFLDLLAPCLLGSGQVKQGQSPIPGLSPHATMIEHGCSQIDGWFSHILTIHQLLWLVFYCAVISRCMFYWCLSRLQRDVYRSPSPTFSGGVPQSPSSSCFLVRSCHGHFSFESARGDSSAPHQRSTLRTWNLGRSDAKRSVAWELKRWHLPTTNYKVGPPSYKMVYKPH